MTYIPTQAQQTNAQLQQTQATYAYPRCECHDCTQARERQRIASQPLQGISSQPNWTGAATIVNPGTPFTNT